MLRQLPERARGPHPARCISRRGRQRQGADPAVIEQLRSALQGLHPWRKGPFELFGVHIDTEWRSDWKWDRLAHAIDDLAGRRVLDVGCGNGYHCWRMQGAGAAEVIGIDPTPLFVLQYWALRRYLRGTRCGCYRWESSSCRPELQAFDSVFSMGVFYHRRSPFDHLLELRDCLRPGGQLVLETLVIEGGPGTGLVPEGRYASMGNVWFLPGLRHPAGLVAQNGLSRLPPGRCEPHHDRRTARHRLDALRVAGGFPRSGGPQPHNRGLPAPRRAIVTARGSR